MRLGERGEGDTVAETDTDADADGDNGTILDDDARRICCFRSLTAVNTDIETPL